MDAKFEILETGRNLYLQKQWRRTATLKMKSNLLGTCSAQFQMLLCEGARQINSYLFHVNNPLQKSYTLKSFHRQYRIPPAQRFATLLMFTKCQVVRNSFKW